MKTEKFQKRLYQETVIAAKACLRGVIVISSMLVLPWVAFYFWSYMRGWEEPVKNKPLIQAICDYRAENGMLPAMLQDLTPHYLPFGEGRFQVLSADHRLYCSKSFLGGVETYYEFGESSYQEDVGWSLSGYGIVKPTRPEKKGEDRIQARLLEYDRLIKKHPDQRWRLLNKLEYLKSINQLPGSFQQGANSS